MWVKSGPRRLKTQNGILQPVLKEMYELEITFRIEYLLPPINPFETIRIFYHLNIMSPVSKCNYCTEALFSAGMEAIYNRFPIETSLYIYTDG